MSVKKSVSLSNSSVAFAESRFEDLNWSPILNGALSDLQYLLKESLPDLSEAEWRPILNAYNGHFFEPSLTRNTTVSIASCIMDDHGALELSELPEEYREPVKRIAKLTAAEQLAVLDVTRRFWLRCGRGKLAGDSLKKQLDNLVENSTG